MTMPPLLEQRFAAMPKILVHQQESWFADLFEVNVHRRYDVYDGRGVAQFVISEQRGTVASEVVRRAQGAYGTRMAVVTDARTDDVWLRLIRRPRANRIHMDIEDRTGTRLGSVRRQGHRWGRYFDVLDASDQARMELRGDFFSLQKTYRLMRGEEVRALIRRDPQSGMPLAKSADERYTIDARAVHPLIRVLLMAATVLVARLN